MPVNKWMDKEDVLHLQWNTRDSAIEEERISFAATQTDLEISTLSKSKWKSLSCIQLFATPWTSQNTGVSSRSLLQGIFHLRDGTQVSHIAGRFFTSWVSREAQEYWNG